MTKNILIVGGSSGVGLELARHYIAEGHTVAITGRTAPEGLAAQFIPFAMTASSERLVADIDGVVSAFGQVQTLIYAAGFLQRGTIDALDDSALLTMAHVGLVAPMMLVSRLKPLAPTPLKVMLITSSSQYTPRPLEPAYTATKAGLGMLGASLARDPAIGKVLVAAPSGIRTRFWAGTPDDTSAMLDPVWVANQIVELSSGPYKYRFAKLLRGPARTEIEETLDNDLNPVG